jgi:hypothetical protein
MTRTPMLIAVVALGVVLATAVPAAGGSGRAAGTLPLSHVILKGKFTAGDCPQGAPADDNCWTIANAGTVRGLGAVTETGVLYIGSPNTACEKWQSAPVLTVAGKGTIQLSVRAPGDGCVACACSGQIRAVTQDYTVTGGTGAYEGASGSGTIVSAGVAFGFSGSDTFEGTVVAPAATFDLSPPTIAGATAKVVRAPKGKTRVRVRYAVGAQDDVDGSLSATCKPASGSLFRIGRTRVTCTATDSSANAATAAFTVTVKR